MNELERELEFRDLQWISGVEKAVLHASVEAGLFDRLKETKDIAELSRITKINTRILEAVLPVLQNLNANALLAQPLDERNQKTARRIQELFLGGEAFLRGTAESFTAMWEKGEIDPQSAQTFSRAMYDNSILPAQVHCEYRPFANLGSFVDLGGGGGAWAQKALEHHPSLKFTIFDLANVCTATTDILKKETLALENKVSYAAGSFFRDPLPKSDGYLLSNILHDWPIPTCEALLSRIHANIPKGAKLYIHECLLDENKQGPRFTCLFHFLMLLNHSAQQFTFSELQRLLTKCRFSGVKVVSKAAHYSLIECVAQ